MAADTLGDVVVDRGLWGILLWLVVIGALVLMAVLAAWMVQARADRTRPEYRGDTPVPQGVTGRSGEGAR